MKRKLIALSLSAALLLAAFPVGIYAAETSFAAKAASVVPYRLGCDIFRYIPDAAKWMEKGLNNADPLTRSGYALLYYLLWPGAMAVNRIGGLSAKHECGICVPDYDAPVTLRSEILGGFSKSGRKCWTPAGEGDSVGIQLERESTINLAVIEEIGNQVQYFRLQAWVGGAWQTIYRCEKIQRLRLCTFDPVTTDRVRLVIDKIRGGNTPVRIKSISLYNEPEREAADFQTTLYEHINGSEPPSAILARGEAYARTFSRFYEVYNTIIVFDAVNWDGEGSMYYRGGGEEWFAREIAALREIIALRANPPHDVRIIVCALPDGAFGRDPWESVNLKMAEHWEDVADQMIDFLVKYDLDGLDIDWEFPRTAEDWQCYDNFIARLDDGMKRVKPGAALTAALSGGFLGMAPETLARFDQLQYMAYDGFDEDGFHSGLHEAQKGLAEFVRRGVDVSRINIGIGAYGRPADGRAYWPNWRDQPGANYWDCKYYDVPYGDLVFDVTYCSPAVAGDKVAYALFAGAGGVMVWDSGGDRTMDDPVSVACGIENALKRYTITW